MENFVQYMEKVGLYVCYTESFSSKSELCSTKLNSSSYWVIYSLRELIHTAQICVYAKDGNKRSAINIWWYLFCLATTFSQSKDVNVAYAYFKIEKSFILQGVLIHKENLYSPYKEVSSMQFSMGGIFSI